jgi:hypothetical protein
MNQLVPITSATLPALVAAAGERSGYGFTWFAQHPPVADIPVPTEVAQPCEPNRL